VLQTIRFYAGYPFKSLGRALSIGIPPPLCLIDSEPKVPWLKEDAAVAFRDLGAKCIEQEIPIHSTCYVWMQLTLSSNRRGFFDTG